MLQQSYGAPLISGLPAQPGAVSAIPGVVPITQQPTYGAVSRPAMGPGMAPAIPPLVQPVTGVTQV